MSTDCTPPSEVNGTVPRIAPPQSVDITVEVTDENSAYIPNASPPVTESPGAFTSRDGANVESISNLPFKRDPPVARGPYYTTEVDIIAVPAIGGDPEKTWATKASFTADVMGTTPSVPSEFHKAIVQVSMSPGQIDPITFTDNYRSRLGVDRMEPAWITRGIRGLVSEARVLLYDHGVITRATTMKILANRLLKSIGDLRRIENSTRPLFFICHSTGGLIVKMALSEAQRSKNSILGDCYGITFFSTPHRGSSHLARLDFASNIANIMSLSAPLPECISQQLHLDHPLLSKLDSDFRSLATELQVWTFFETEDTNITHEYHAPITSIKSALLNLRHEVVYPLMSDHASCASFGNKNNQTKESYLGELTGAIKKALELGNIKHTEINLEYQVRVEVTGFYDMGESIEAPMEVWSTTRSLRDFKRHGPAKLLEERLSEINAPPRERQHLRHDTRAPTLLHSRPNDANPVPPNAQKSEVSNRESDPELGLRGRFRKSRSQERVRQETKPPQLLLAPNIGHEMTPVRRPIPPVPSIAVHADDGFLSPAKGNPIRERSRERSRARSRYRAEPISINNAPITLNKPDISKQKLVWIHVPFNNPTWVRDVLSTISVEKGRNVDSKLLAPDHWESKHVRGRHAEHHACFLKPGCAVLGGEITSPIASPRQYFGNTITPSQIQMYLYIPYLHFDTYKSIVRRRVLTKRRIRQGRSRPIPQSVAKLDSLEMKVIWQFLGHDPPINCRRTLDQFGYPSLLDTRARDDDQMLYKMTKQRFAHHSDIFPETAEEKQRFAEFQRQAEESDSSSDSSKSSFDTEDEIEAFEELRDDDEEEEEEDENDILDGNVLMVDQLWLWIVDSETTVTFFTKKEAQVTDGRLFQQGDLRNSIFNEVNADLTSRCDNSFDLAALVTLHAVTVLFERTNHPDLEIFRTFEEAISILTEKMTSSFKQFRSRGFRDKTTEHDDHLRAHNIRAKHKREGDAAERQNRENTSALLELRDIEDELHTLEELFDAQKDEIGTMIHHYQRDDLKHLTMNGLVFLHQAQDHLSNYKRHAHRMIDDVKSTREDFDKLLQMVQRQAQVDEVRLQRLQADLASAQSRSVMIFTVFTVIFLPLTFFCGLFGMNTREWGGGDNLALRTIGLITIPTSFVIITITCIVAWSSRFRKVTNRSYRAVVRLTKSIRKSTMEFLYHIPAAATLANKEARKKIIEERREAKRMRQEEKRQASLYNEDFWDDHVTARDSDYMVPPQNRKSVIYARKKALQELKSKGRFGFLGKAESDMYMRTMGKM